MVIYLPGQSVDEEPLLDELTPREIVRELDKHVVGQAEAKRAVAIALRNRIRRQKLPPEMAEEVMPKNILMIGPTGVGKTELARRLARLANSPFLKVEASKFTEVGLRGPRRRVDDPRPGGYLDRHGAGGAAGRGGRSRRAERRGSAAGPADADDAGAERERRAHPRKAARAAARGQARRAAGRDRGEGPQSDVRDHDERRDRGDGHQSQGHAAQPLRPEDAPPQDAGGGGARLPGAGRGAEAHRHGPGDARARWSGWNRAASSSWTRSTRSPGRESGHGPDVSREGVQRDILPIVEGTTVNTRYGFVRTDHILFIAAGAFHVSKPSDMIPELQGRFPIRVELKSLSVEDFIRILKEPKNALAKQYTALLETEGIKLILTDDALEEVAKFAAQVNESSENIGARRLHTIMEKLLEEVSFEGPDLKKKTVKVDANYVRKQLADIVKDQDLSRYIL